MSRKTRRDVIAALGTAAALGLAGCSSGGSGTDTTTGSDPEGDDPTTTATEEEDPTTTTTEMANVRVAHFSPDAPNVDVYVDGSRVLSDVPFGTLGDYLQVPTGTRSVRITAADDADTVVFEDDLDLSAGDYTVAAVGQFTSSDPGFQVLALEDDNSDPGEDTARVRLLHAVPDAPLVDVTLAPNGDTVYDGVEFGESGYAELPAGSYTLQVRPVTMSGTRNPAAEFDVTVEGSTVYTAAALGYLSPDDDSGEAPIDLGVFVDAAP